jgi:Hsp20/alpha crystallin family
MRSCQPTGLGLQHAEVRESHFARAFTLSAEFDSSKIDANLQDGLLPLTIPRRDEARQRSHRSQVRLNDATGLGRFRLTVQSVGGERHRRRRDCNVKCKT